MFLPGLGAAIRSPARVVKNYEPVTGQKLENPSPSGRRIASRTFNQQNERQLGRRAAGDRRRKTPAPDGRRPTLRMGWRKLARVMLEVTA